MTSVTSTRRPATPFRLQLSQERIVVAISIILFSFFSITLNGFLQLDNLTSLLKSVSVLGILAIGMSLVVIGRGIDLTMVAVMVFSTAWSFAVAGSGMPPALALSLGLGLALLVGIANGLLIAYVEIPAIFATLAVATALTGLGRFALVPTDTIFLTGDLGVLAQIGNGRILYIPTPVILFALAACIAYVGLRYTKHGRFFYAMGDNPAAARLSGIPTRPMTVLMYVISAFVAFAAGIVMAMTVSSVNTRLAGSTMVYDIILVVVIGGIGLSGGKGSVRNVIAGTVLIGLLLNGMTIMNISYPVQNIIKSLILLLAIIADSILNPRDEQTSQQGDI